MLGRGARYLAGMADDEALEWVVHTLVAEGLRSAPICGQPDSGPPPFGHPIRLVVCPACMEFGPAGMPRELTMRHHVSVVREQLREKLRRMSEQERDRYREQVRMIAAASLQDPEAAPALYDEGRLMAALYAIGAIRSGFFQQIGRAHV